ncbi:MAG: site-specific integrase [Mycobacterium pseudokansasii]|uniref:tyrosine-type recombinase/integrase n=1 Tax=Mycobacterium pseudokansasii TaxID=2341080 RepID=UPI0023F552E2|nr:site-specific integrase [Mycobacterium pseudokansasii]MBY0389072.1 site-specific integrase [Mycobacterium pseudokansasii]
MALSVVRNLRERRAPLTDEELDAYETDVLSGFVLARASAGLADSTIRGDLYQLDQIRSWFGRPLWEMRPEDADNLFGKTLRSAPLHTRRMRAYALSVFFEFLELRYKVELHHLTGRVVECPIDDMNRPRSSVEPRLRIPPTEAEIEKFFAGWRHELASCRKFATNARNYAVARLAADVGLRINEIRMLDLTDIRWELGRFGKINVRHGKGARRKGPKPRLVPMINEADRNMRWYIEDVLGQFGADPSQHGLPLFPSERRNADGSCMRASADVFRRAISAATDQHLPTWTGKLTPHVLRHFCASQLYLSGMNIFAIQELLGHSWTATTARYVHVHATHVEDAWVAGHKRVSERWKGLSS